MSKLPLIAAATSFACLASCIQPPPPPPRFRPNPPYAPDLVSPDDARRDGPATDEPAQPPAPPSAVPGTDGGYPTATRTENPDQVISPYEPYNVIDISGPPRILSGKLARDPSNQKIFRVP